MSVGTSLASLETSDLFSNTVTRRPVVMCYLYTSNSPTFHVSVDVGGDDSLHHQVDTALGRISEGQMVEDYGGKWTPVVRHFTHCLHTPHLCILPPSCAVGYGMLSV